MLRVSSETITLRPTERKKRERATTENAGRGDFERERERERERNWKIHFGRDKREESCLRRKLKENNDAQVRCDRQVCVIKSDTDAAHKGRAEKSTERYERYNKDKAEQTEK